MPLSIDEVSYTLELPDVPADIRREVGNLIVEEMKNDMLNGISPVDGSPFKELSVKYAERKLALKGSSDANLYFDGDMQDAIKSKLVDGGVQIYISKAKEIPKSYNHCVGDTLPKRQFFPDEDAGETFRDEILEKIADLLPEDVEVEGEIDLELRRADETEVSTEILLTDAFIKRLIDGD